MAKTRTRYHVKPSNLPYLVTGALWLVLSCFMKMYRLTNVMIVAGLCLIAYGLMRKFKVFADIQIPYEEEIPYEELELQEVLDEGYGYLNELQEANRQIPDAEMTEDINDVVSIALSILKRVKENPRNLKDIRKFISFYLPTITKLLHQYVELQNADIELHASTVTKEKVSNMLKTVEKAFRAQYDSLFEEEALDISTDIKVLEGMMAQEGILNQ